MRYSKKLTEYELLDMADGNKLEKWGEYILIRPDPQIVWKNKTTPKLWEKASAKYIRSSTGGGHWEKLKSIKDNWDIGYNSMQFNLKLMGFKHTGLFPEQSVNWDYLIDKISNRTKNRGKNKCSKFICIYRRSNSSLCQGWSQCLSCRFLLWNGKYSKRKSKIK